MMKTSLAGEVTVRYIGDVEDSRGDVQILVGLELVSIVLRVMVLLLIVFFLLLFLTSF